MFVQPAVVDLFYGCRELRCVAFEPRPALVRQYFLARENGAGRIDANTEGQDPSVPHGDGDLGRSLQAGMRGVSSIQYDEEEPWHRG